MSENAKRPSSLGGPKGRKVAKKKNQHPQNSPAKRTPQEPGTFSRRGHLYRSLGTVSYETRDGRWINMIHVEGRYCADCGDRFRFPATKRQIQTGQLRRRCDRHSAPGYKAEPWQPKRGRS